MPLFEKPLYQLRTGFVGSCLARPDMFGRPDIGIWVHGFSQRDRGHSGSWETPRFLEVLKEQWDSDGSRFRQMEKTLHRYVTPAARPPQWFLAATRPEDPARTRVMSLLGGNDVTIYYPRTAGKERVALVTKGRDTFAIDHEVDRSSTPWGAMTGIRRARMDEVISLVVDEFRQSLPKAGTAAGFFVKMYEETIETVRVAAQRDFNEAVAVSADGTRIVKADQVVVILNDHYVLVYPTIAFADPSSAMRDSDRKILRAERLQPTGSRPVLAKTESIKEYIRSMMESEQFKRKYELGDSQYLDPRSALDRRRWLFTDFKYCPSPPPTYGKEEIRF